VGNSTTTNQGTVGTTNTFDPATTAASNIAIAKATAGANTAFSAPSADQAVAGMSGNQTTAYNAANANAGSLAQNDKTINASWTNPTTQASYMNPYENSVLDAQKAYATQAYQQQQAATATSAGMNNSFGGDREAVTNAQNTQNYNMNLNSINATGLSNAYTQGEAQFNTAQQEALGANAAENSALASTGSIEQQISQNKDTYNTNVAAQQRDWESTQAAKLATTLASVPKGSSSTSNFKSTQSGNTTLLQALGAASGVASLLFGNNSGGLVGAAGKVLGGSSTGSPGAANPGVATGTAPNASNNYQGGVGSTGPTPTQDPNVTGQPGGSGYGNGGGALNAAPVGGYTQPETGFTNPAGGAAFANSGTPSNTYMSGGYGGYG